MQGGNLNNLFLEHTGIDKITHLGQNFDCASCGFGIFFLPDMQAGLQNILSCLKSKGRIAISSFKDGSFTPLSDLCINLFSKYGAVPPEIYTWDRLNSYAKHAELFSSVGLKNIHSHTKQVGYYLTSFAQWWEIILGSGFRALANQLSADALSQYKREHAQQIAPYITDKGLWLDIEVIFSTADK